MAGVLRKRGNLETDKHTGRPLCEDQGGDKGEASTCRGNATACEPASRRWGRGLGLMPPPGPQKEPALLRTNAFAVGLLDSRQ